MASLDTMDEVALQVFLVLIHKDPDFNGVNSSYVNPTFFRIHADIAYEAAKAFGDAKSRIDQEFAQEMKQKIIEEHLSGEKEE